MVRRESRSEGGSFGAAARERNAARESAAAREEVGARGKSCRPVRERWIEGRDAARGVSFGAQGELR
jgi:hypothetical protein